MKIILQLSRSLTLESEILFLASFRSAQGGSPSLGLSEAPAQVQPGLKREAQPSESSLPKASSTDSNLSESFPGSHTWENKGPGSLVAWASDTQTLEARAEKAKAWETQAYEAQKRYTQPKQTSVLGLESAQALKQKPLIKMTEVPEKKKKKKKSEAPYTRPLWSNKVEYILAQVGYSVRAINLWRFPYLWLHHGGCKSGDQESGVHQGLARQKPSQASNSMVSGTCRGYRLGTGNRRGGGA